jgi:hypothetical protein
MTDERDRTDGTEPDPDADRWSAWLPSLDPTSDRTGAAGPGQSDPPSQATGSARPAGSGAPGGPLLPQRSSPGVPPSTPPLASHRFPPPVPPPAPSQRARFSYRSAPPPQMAPQRAVAPRRHLGLAVFATFFGFPLLGIVAIVLSLSVGRLVRAGRPADAERASRRARNVAIVALLVQILWTLYTSLLLSS